MKIVVRHSASKSIYLVLAFLVLGLSVLFSTSWKSVLAGDGPPLYEQVDVIGDLYDTIDLQLYPFRMTSDSVGNQYIIDNVDDTIQKVSPTGEILMTFGYPYAEGGVSYPNSIAVNDSGEIYISDGDYMTIRVYSPTGTYLREINTYAAGLSFGYNSAIAFDSSNRLYVADGSRIHIYNNDDTYNTTLDSPAGGPTLDQPFDIHVDTLGNIYSANNFDNSVYVYDSSMNHILTVGSTELTRPISVETASDGTFYVGMRTLIKHFDMSGNLLHEFGDAIPHSNGSLTDLKDIIVTPEGNIKTIESSPLRIQTFSPSGVYLDQVGAESTKDGMFGRPGESTVDSNDNIYVTDGELNRIQVFNSNGDYLYKFGIEGIGDGEFDRIRDIRYNPADNRIYVSDAPYNVGIGRMQIFETDGTFVTSWTWDGKNRSNDFEIATNGEIYIDDLDHDRILVFDSNGVLQRQWQTLAYNQEPGVTTIGYSTEIALDDENNVYVMYENTSYVEKYSSTGELLGYFGYRRDATPEHVVDGYFANASSMVIGPDGYMYIADALRGRISVYDLSGNFIRGIGTTRGDSFEQLYTPTGIAFDSNDRLLITDSQNNEVYVYDFRETSDISNPSQPLNVTIASSLDEELTVNWQAPADDGDEALRSYIIEYRLNNKHGEWQQYAQIDASATSYTMTNLAAGDYQVRIIADNRSGHSQPSQASSYARVDGYLTLDNVIEAPHPHAAQFIAIKHFSDGSKVFLSSNSNEYFTADQNNVFTGKFKSFGSGLDNLHGPDGLDIDSNDNIYISDGGNRRVISYEKDGTYRSHFMVPSPYYFPTKLQIDEDRGYIYVLATTSSLNAASTNRILRFTIGGTFVDWFSTSITTPTDIRLSDSGELFVVHRTGGTKISELDPNTGAILASYDIAAYATNPDGFALTDDGGFIVNDRASSRYAIQHFDSNGNYLGGFETGGTDVNYNIRSNPRNVEFYDNSLYMSDMVNGRIIVYAVFDSQSPLPENPPVDPGDTTPPALPPESDGSTGIGTVGGDPNDDEDLPRTGTNIFAATSVAIIMIAVSAALLRKRRY